MQVNLAAVFAAVQRARADLRILDWGISTPSLEEIFIKFARSIGAEGGV